MVLAKFSDTANALSQQRETTVKVRNELETSSKRLQELSEQKVNIESSLRAERLKMDEVRSENERLKVNLQAKKQREAEAAQLASVQKTQVAQEAQQPAPTVRVSGDKHSWLAASGIPASEWASVDFIVTRESGWNPNAVNPTSGACGLGQQLPCGKWAGAWNDPVAALRAQYGYVKERYGGYPQAVAFWQANHWY